MEELTNKEKRQIARLADINLGRAEQLIGDTIENLQGLSHLESHLKVIHLNEILSQLGGERKAIQGFLFNKV